jgi:hypothetical protein
MSQSNLERRLAAIEQTLDRRLASIERQVTSLREEIERVSQPDWRRTVGMFAGNEGMKSIIGAGRKIREADREKARKAAGRADERERRRAKA